MFDPEGIKNFKIVSKGLITHLIGCCVFFNWGENFLAFEGHF